jgi:fructokinase
VVFISGYNGIMVGSIYRMGVDLGGTKSEVIILDHGESELYLERRPTPKGDSYQRILSSVIDLISDASKKIPEGENYSIGIGIPGSIDSDTGLVHNANTTCLIGKPFQRDLQEGLGRKITMENDANCFTLAECRLGAAKDYGLVFGVIMGTGCGGGICINGHVRQGGHGIAGEWGHFSIDPNGSLCYCGNIGCIETKISGSGVESAFFRRYKKRLKMQEIVRGYRNGDPDCQEAFVRFLDDFGRSLGGLISILDPDAVVLGGGLSNIDELYSAGVERVRKYAFHRHIRTPILKNILGDSAGVFGAAWIGK